MHIIRVVDIHISKTTKTRCQAQQTEADGLARQAGSVVNLEGEMVQSLLTGSKEKIFAFEKVVYGEPYFLENDIKILFGENT
jgi:hypothetical protein